jgi:hypothetical protein
MLFTIGILFYSCEDFVERDLSDQWVYVSSPSDFSSSDALTQTLNWKEVKGATSYNLQLFKTTDNTYLTVSEFIVDTTVKATHYTCTLKPGFYKWQIYGKNNGSQTGLSVFRFQIDSTGDISNQKIILVSPANNAIKDSLKLTFDWKTLSTADGYNLQIFPLKGSSAVYSEVVRNPPVEYTFAKAGDYRWRVSAIKGTFVSPYSEFTLHIDTLRPATPVVVSPKNDTTALNIPIQLKWNTVTTATLYKVQVATDSTMNDSQMTVSETTSNTFYNFDKGTAATKYYWRVKAIKDTHEGSYSWWWSFKRK